MIAHFNIIVIFFTSYQNFNIFQALDIAKFMVGVKIVKVSNKISHQTFCQYGIRVLLYMLYSRDTDTHMQTKYMHVHTCTHVHACTHTHIHRQTDRQTNIHTHIQNNRIQQSDLARAPESSG